MPAEQPQRSPNPPAQQTELQVYVPQPDFTDMESGREYPLVSDSLRQVTTLYGRGWRNTRPTPGVLGQEDGRKTATD